MPRRSSTLDSAKMLRTSSSTTSTFLPMQVLVGAVQPLERLALGLGQVGDHAMQEQRRLVEQAIGRLHALDHDAAREHAQARILLGGQLLAGEHDHRQVAQRDFVADRLQHFEPRHVGQPQVEHGAVVGLLAQRDQRGRSRPRRGDVDVVVRRAAR